MQTRAKRRRLRRLLITQVFSPEARQAILRNLLSFAPPRSLASLEAAAPLFGRPVPAPLTLLAVLGGGGGGGGEGKEEEEAEEEPSLVELVVRDALGARLGLPGLARAEDPRRAGESWPALLRFALRMSGAAAAGHLRCTISAGGSYSVLIEQGAVYTFGGAAYRKLGHGGEEDQQRPKRGAPGRWNWRRLP